MLIAIKVISGIFVIFSIIRESLGGNKLNMIFKGLIIGMIVSFPIGPLGIIAIQRTINNGWKSGFFSGVGAAASDVVYSLCAVFGISFIDDIIHKHKYLINNAIGALFLVLGLNIFMNALKDKAIVDEKRKFIIHPGISNFLLGLSNPMTFLVFLTIFTKIGLKINTLEVGKNMLFVLSIFIGSTILWISVSKLIDSSKRNFKIEIFCIINKIIGASIAVFGMCSLFRGIMKF